MLVYITCPTRALLDRHTQGAPETLETPCLFRIPCQYLRSPQCLVETLIKIVKEQILLQ